jgi:hypothetical protein
LYRASEEESDAGGTQGMVTRSLGTASSLDTMHDAIGARSARESIIQIRLQLSSVVMADAVVECTAKKRRPHL